MAKSPTQFLSKPLYQPKTLDMALPWAGVALVEYLLLYAVYPSVHEHFRYMSFEMTGYNHGLHLASLFLLVIFGVLSVGVFARVNLLITAVPTGVMSGFGAVSTELGILSMFLQAYLVLLDRNWSIFPSLPDVGPRHRYIVLGVSAVFSLGVLIVFRDLVKFSNLTDVYGNRSLYADRVTDGGGLLTYSKLAIKVLLIALVGLAYEKRYISVAAIVTAFVFYTIFSSKFMLFLPFVAWAFPVMMRKARWVLIALLLIGGMYFAAKETAYEINVVGLMRRAFLLPCLLNDIYLTMMHELGPQYFTTSALSPFFDSQGVVLAREANVHLLGDDTSNANTGIIGSGVIQLGFAGPFIYATIYVFLANLNSGYRKKDPVTLSVLCVFILTALGISDITTTLFLHGGIVFCLLMRYSRP